MHVISRQSRSTAAALEMEVPLKKKVTSSTGRLLLLLSFRKWLTAADRPLVTVL
jgi:hypothetical protein